MPKDRSKYRYFDVGLERNSWALVKLEEDARRHHMSDQPGKLIALRLTEYYEQREQETSSREPLPARNGRMVLALPDEQNRSNDSIQTQDDDVLEISYYATENADEAADYWADVK